MINLSLFFYFLDTIVFYDDPVLFQLRIVATYCAGLCTKEQLYLRLIPAIHAIISRLVLRLTYITNGRLVLAHSLCIWNFVLKQKWSKVHASLVHFGHIGAFRLHLSGIPITNQDLLTGSSESQYSVLIGL